MDFGIVFAVCVGCGLVVLVWWCDKRKERK